MDTTLTLYLASPLGFSESGRIALPHVVSTLTATGWTVLDPWADSAHEPPAHPASPHHADTSSAALASLTTACARNEQAIEKSALVVAVLDGPDVDSGVAAEIGFAYARGKTIIGYRGDFRVSGEFAAAIINMQVRYWIEASGGHLAFSLTELQAALEKLRSAIESGMT